MATKEQVQMILQYLEETHPAKFYKALNEENAGIGAVLRCLHESKGPVTAGDISEFMQVSTARVAALLKKMAAQGLVTKECDAADARFTIVRISPKGEEKIEQIHDTICRQVSAVIDRVGMEKMMEYISISEQIRAAVAPPDLNLDPPCRQSKQTTEE